MFRFSLILLAALALGLTGCREKAEDSSAQSAGAEEAVVLRVLHDNVGTAAMVMKEMAAAYEAETGVAVEVITTPNDSNERLTQFLNYLGAQSPDVDIYMCDVVWAGMLGGHFADLAGPLADVTAETFPSITENNTHEGRLVLAPYYTDAPALYYRTDLLEKYGFEGPPKTWEELSSMAKTIQDGERAAGSGNFWGYVWQGRAYEGLTCNMLEWQVSAGGSAILAADGSVAVNEPALAGMLEMARSWVGTISPPGVLGYAEEESRGVWQSGNAAFMRNWPYAWTPGQSEDSVIRGKFSLAPLPGGTRSAAALGGQMLAVSRYSRHQAAAAEFVRRVTSAEGQRRRAITGGYLSTSPSIYSDSEIAAALPYFPLMKEVFENAVPRPASRAGRYYNELSSIYAGAGHRVLTGTATAEEALTRAQTDIQGLLR